MRSTLSLNEIRTNTTVRKKKRNEFFVLIPLPIVYTFLEKGISLL